MLYLYIYVFVHSIVFFTVCIYRFLFQMLHVFGVFVGHQLDIDEHFHKHAIKIILY